MKSKANIRLCFVRKLGQFKVDRTFITLFYKSCILSCLFVLLVGEGTVRRKGRMKIDRIIEISEKFTTHVPHLDELYNKKTLDKPYPSQNL